MGAFIVRRAFEILGHSVDLAFHALPNFHFRDPSRR
jgi:hypothetical protein